MTIRKNAGPTKSSAKAVGGRGLLIALVLAGIGIQGCSKEDSPATSVGTDSPTIDQVREDENGVDITDGSEAVQSVVPLAKTAPSCVRISYEYSRFFVTAKVQNWCTDIQRVRLIWSRAFDGNCRTMHPRGQFWEERGRQAQVTEIRGC